MDKECVWKYLLVPNPDLIKKLKTKELLSAFNTHSQGASNHLQYRFHHATSIQKSIDDAILRAFGFEEIGEKLPLIYKLFDSELQNLLDVMGHSATPK